MKMKINDQVVIYPTDTVWGIGGSIFSQKSYDKITDIKKTAPTKPLSIMFPTLLMIKEYFDLPAFMTQEWLIDFFNLESTLGLPIEFLKKELPLWLTQKSPIITIRFVDAEIIKKVGEEIKTPFFTTSLNLTGQAPIVGYKNALEFKDTHAPDALLFGDDSHELSGESSSIIFYTPEKTSTFTIIRSGRFIEQIKKRLAIS